MRTIVIRTNHTIKGQKNCDATVYFQNGVFDTCDFHINNLKYTLEDWAFLKEVAEFILLHKDLEELQYKKAISAYETAAYKKGNEKWVISDGANK